MAYADAPGESNHSRKLSENENHWKQRVIQYTIEGKAGQALPQGPFAQIEDCACSMLFFVPEGWMAKFSNAATGGYGYTHLAIDCCEVDTKTGKRVMIEATAQHGVSRSFQDAYGARRFIPIPLKPQGIDCEEFCDRIKSKLGQKYDFTEALSKGLIDNPVEQMCSSLAKNCLPRSLIDDMVNKAKEGKLRKKSIVDYGSGKIFVSPNAFAEYFGVPREPNQSL